MRSLVFILLYMIADGITVYNDLRLIRFVFKYIYSDEAKCGDPFSNPQWLPAMDNCTIECDPVAGVCLTNTVIRLQMCRSFPIGCQKGIRRSLGWSENFTTSPPSTTNKLPPATPPKLLPKKKKIHIQPLTTTTELPILRTTSMFDLVEGFDFTTTTPVKMLPTSQETHDIQIVDNTKSSEELYKNSIDEGFHTRHIPIRKLNDQKSQEILGSYQFTDLEAIPRAPTNEVYADGHLIGPPGFRPMNLESLSDEYAASVMESITESPPPYAVPAPSQRFFSPIDDRDGNMLSHRPEITFSILQSKKADFPGSPGNGNKKKDRSDMDDESGSDKLAQFFGDDNWSSNDVGDKNLSPALTSSTETTISPQQWRPPSKKMNRPSPRTLVYSLGTKRASIMKSLHFEEPTISFYRNMEDQRAVARKAVQKMEETKIDRFNRCCEWAISGMCDRNWQKIRLYCPKSCGSLVCEDIEGLQSCTRMINVDPEECYQRIRVNSLLNFPSLFPQNMDDTTDITRMDPPKPPRAKKIKKRKRVSKKEKRKLF